MEILKSDRGDGYAKLEVENKDDLWYLKDIVKEGDRLKAFTQRTKLDGREKKSTYLTLRAEKVEYQEDRLRVTGEIIKGDEDVEMGYHTFNIESGKEFEIWKDSFSDEAWSRLEEAESHKSYRVLFVLVQKGEADLYIVEESGIRDMSKIDINIPGKLYSDQDDGENFYNQVCEVVQRTSDKVDSTVLCGPGFEKNRIKNMLDGKVDSLFMQDTSVIGRTGLNEAIKRGALDKVVESSRISEESEVIQELMEALREDRKVSYGEPVDELVEHGAVKKLIMTAEKYRENPEIAEKTEEMGGEVSIVHKDHEAGERLDGLGGKAAILRYQPD